MKKISFFRAGSLSLVMVLSFLTASAQLGVTTSTGLFTPQSILHVHDNNTSGQVFQLTNSTSGYDAATKGFSISFGSGFSSAIRNQYNNPSAGFSFWTNDGTDRERLSINNNGRIGIGTNNPQYLLHIAGNSNITTKRTTPQNFQAGTPKRTPRKSNTINPRLF